MIISHIVELLLLALFSALIGFGFNKIQEPDMIFEKYKEVLEYLAGNKFRTWRFNIFLFKVWWNGWTVVPDWLTFNAPEDKWWITSPHISVKQYKFLYYLTKPLGLCIVCNTTWIGIVLTLSTAHTLSFIGGVCAICVGVASASIVIFLENLFKLIQKSN